MSSNQARSIVILSTMMLLLTTALSGPAGAETPTVNGALKPASPPMNRDVRWRRVGPELTALHEQYQAFRLTAPGQPFDLQSRFFQVSTDTVLVDAVADGDVAQLVSALEKLGALDVTAFKRVVSARLPLAAIPALADVTSLRFARPAMAMTNVGDTTSQADPAMNTDDARGNFGVNGAGLTIGVMSDSFDTGPGSYADDIATLDLPADIEVLADFADGSDEGRAMAQLIHDVAPGAALSFHTAFGGQAEFALGIQELAGCPPGSEPGCTPAVVPADVIVDDVSYFAAPMFQDGIVAQAADLAHDAGVPFFSSAGNSARSSWEGPFVSSGISPPGYSDGDAHDFDPGPGVDIFQQVTFTGSSRVVSFQWDEPFFSVSGAPGSASDMDYCLYADPPGTDPIFCAATGNLGGDPVELSQITGSGVANVVIVKYLPSGGPDPGFMKYVAFSTGFSVTDVYPNVPASTSFGHSNAEGAIGVGAAFYFETPAFGTDPALLEPFSSAGGTPILFDTAGVRLPLPEVRMRPQFVAPDGTNTTFFGSDIPDPGDGSDADTFPNFFGTSAAAPHAAAAAALILEAFPGLTPSGVEHVLISSATENDMGLTAGFDFDSGYGLIDGNTAVGSVDESTNCDGVADLILTGTANSAPGTFSATDSITYSNAVIEDITAYAPIHDFEGETSIGGTSAFGGCP